MNRGWILAGLLVLMQGASAQVKPNDAIEGLLDSAAGMVKDGTKSDEAIFDEFLRGIAEGAADAGISQVHMEVLAMKRGSRVPDGSTNLASRILRKFVVTRYGQMMVKDLQTLIGFRTHAVTGKKNWDLPEFVRQRQWLRERSTSLGLLFKTYDGRVEEIMFPAGDSALAILTHGDVQPAEGQTWSSPPWDGAIVDGKIVGRGAEDDKGPIIATMYAMKALKVSGWRLSASVKLLVANGEESDWSEIPYYLERSAPPARTLGIDASYPVTYAQKGFGIATFRAEAGIQKERGGKWTVESISGGSGVSIIPAMGEAVLHGPGDPEKDLALLKGLADAWMMKHPPASLGLALENGRVKITAHGKGGHSSVPETGHNALGDLAAFLATLDLNMDPIGSLVAFLGTHVGVEIDGSSLGIARKDDLFGMLTHNLAQFRRDSLGLAALSSVRISRGFADGEIDSLMQETVHRFNEHHQTAVRVSFLQATRPHIADEGLVSALLSVWEGVMGEAGKPIAIGGGTQARLFPNGVDFGPGFPGQVYRGHAPEEHLTTKELMLIAELTTAALWRLSTD